MSNAHVRYAVKTPNGYVGSRRFDYSRGSHASDATAFRTARLFTRVGDATVAARYNNGEVVKVYVYILSEMPVP
jgi:hypothetical protein